MGEKARSSSARPQSDPVRVRRNAGAVRPIRTDFQRWTLRTLAYKQKTQLLLAIWQPLRIIWSRNSPVLATGATRLQLVKLLNRIVFGISWRLRYDDFQNVPKGEESDGWL